MVQQIFTSLKEKTVGANEIILSKTNSPNKLIFILSGFITYKKIYEDKEPESIQLKKGDIFGNLLNNPLN